MAKIQREKEIDSTLVNEKFLRKLSNIITECNPSNAKLNKEINVFSSGEKTTFIYLKDLFSDKHLYEKPNSFSMRIYPKKSSSVKHKTIQLYFRVNNKEKRNYYQLIGHDEGKILECEKR